MTPGAVLDLLFETEASGLRAEGLDPEHLGAATFSELVFRRVLERHSERLKDDPALGIGLLGEALPRMPPEALRALAAELRARGHLGLPTRWKRSPTSRSAKPARAIPSARAPAIV